MGRRFSRIETAGQLPDGRVIHTWYSKPAGYTYNEYREIDTRLVKAFGALTSRTTGTYAQA